MKAKNKAWLLGLSGAGFLLGAALLRKSDKQAVDEYLEPDIPRGVVLGECLSEQKGYRSLPVRLLNADLKANGDLHVDAEVLGVTQEEASSVELTLCPKGGVTDAASPWGLQALVKSTKKAGASLRIPIERVFDGFMEKVRRAHGPESGRYGELVFSDTMDSRVHRLSL